ncbi:unnamed protein product [Leptidea sinapis]|uniref:Uncharacterized protein n=1 Tax=Leptidea sinapis TaxID=189913 RepID=A0A5E4R356_9NEOP|nr:unnamed protein product [Leptidea sinapis]
MVDLSGGQDGPLEHAFSNSVFILPGIVVVGLSVFFGYKLYKSIKEKDLKREEKRKAKLMKKKK